MKIVIDGQEVTIPSGSGGGGNPIGTVISFMGTSAPTGYLVCDGAEYEIAAYPALAEFFRQQFGTNNHFGGNGTDTFAVPDLRNLFLRGYHGEAEEQLSEEIGARQEATIFPSVGINRSYHLVYSVDESDRFGSNFDTSQGLESRSAYISQESVLPTGSYRIPTEHTSRPVNMAVLYCIKAVNEGGSGGSGSVEIESYDTNDGWHVRKWSDGYVEMIYKGTNSSQGSYEAPYTYYVIHNQISLPIVLVARYSENLSLLDSSNTGNPKFSLVYTAGDNEKTSRWGVLIMAKATGVAMNYSIVVTGRWK